ncbi:MAG: hypothetical protein ACXAC2_00310 [Candidatus Kariarchaeaceae archaeon]|jgi:hypothetical protein
MMKLPTDEVEWYEINGVPYSNIYLRNKNMCFECGSNSCEYVRSYNDVDYCCSCNHSNDGTPEQSEFCSDCSSDLASDLYDAYKGRKEREMLNG